MESAHALAHRELARRREENRAERERRLARVREEAPEFSEVEAGLLRGGAALARCVLNRGEGFDTVRDSIQRLQAQRARILERLGLPKDYLDEIFTCPNCRDTGYDDHGHPCACLRQLTVRFADSAANLTGRMQEQTFDRVDYGLFANQPAENGRSPLLCIKQAYAIGLRFAETFDETGDNLLLIGSAGTGKTYLSACIANYALGRGKTVYYQTAFRLLDTMEKLKFGRCGEDDAEQAEFAARSAYDAQLLVIDDVGTEFVSAYSSAALFDLVNTRLLKRRSTILSTNLTMEGLEQIYSKRFVSRLLGGYTIIPFVGRDLRMKNFQKNSGESV